MATTVKNLFELVVFLKSLPRGQYCVFDNNHADYNRLPLTVGQIYVRGAAVDTVTLDPSCER